MAEKSGVHLTGADSGWPVGGEDPPAKDGSGIDHNARASRVHDGTIEVSERQAVRVSGTSGTFTLTYDGQTTAAIAYNASESAVASALAALSNIAPGEVLVTVQSPPDDGEANCRIYYVTFAGAKADQDIVAMEGDGTELVPGPVSVSTITPGS